MECWVHYDTILDDDQANQRLKEAWEQDDSKDELHKGVMGAGSVCLQQQSKYLEIRVGREEEGINSLQSELAAMARTLQATPPGVDML
jgi:hypothetical protein